MSPASILERRRDEVDPRIAQRRRQVAADRRRRWLRRTGAVVAVLALVAGAAALTRTPLLDVDELVVQGEVRTPEAAVLEASGLAVGDPILELDEAAAEAAVRALPWVADADVSRSWRDGQVVIAVTEREPAAVVAGADRWALVDASGRVLAVAPRPPAPPAPAPGEAVDEAALAAHEDPAAVLPEAADLAVVAGPEPADPGQVLPDDALPLLAVAAEVPPGVASRVAAVRAEEAGFVLDLRPRGQVLLGPAEGLDVKLRTVTTVLAEVDLTCLATVDVTVADTAVLTRESGCQ